MKYKQIWLIEQLVISVVNKGIFLCKMHNVFFDEPPRTLARTLAFAKLKKYLKSYQSFIQNEVKCDLLDTYATHQKAQ